MKIFCKKKSVYFGVFLFRVGRNVCQNIFFKFMPRYEFYCFIQLGTAYLVWCRHLSMIWLLSQKLWAFSWIKMGFPVILQFGVGLTSATIIFLYQCQVICFIIWINSVWCFLYCRAISAWSDYFHSSYIASSTEK